MAVWENLTEVLEGGIVRLEPLAKRHEEGLFEAARDERIWAWMQYGTALGREEFGSWIDDAISRSAAGFEGAFATIDIGSGEPIGSTRYLALRPGHRGLEIGWTWLAPTYWRTGANVEAKLLMLGHAFERLGCMRVELKTDRRNERSRGAMEALPAKFEGIFRKHMILPDGSVRDSAYYSITDDEWPEVEENLRRRLDLLAGREGAGWVNG
ncbi:GNAT family N-acetyltransferase [Rubrobacter tropicus]|uniref:GNAT family N-acetyltransferase n=1 Tax=Rubrobacter tropicus TaxID=2653851 RepID=A0A6G8QEY9_9ACTN|nr:GNAT family protein [Rubrobacter tropicus]QIN84807.1 GNAT family N-acetyltransferase [Rubrobacter tropicus]